MALSTLIVPVLLTFTACFALGKRVDVYSALTKGAEEGLTVLLHILPSLIALLSAVYMFRASGAMEALGALLAPRTRQDRHSCRDCAASLHPPHLRQRRAGCRIGDHGLLRRRFLCWPRCGGHARLERNDVLHRRRLLRCSGHYENALYYPRRALRRRGDVPRIRVFVRLLMGA